MAVGGLGVPLNHPRFLEWLGVPDSAWLLEMSPGHWCDTLSRDQAMSAAMQLHRDACLMQTHLDILYQYALALHGTASMLQKTIGGGPYPRAEVAVAAPGQHARRASVQMEALGLWRPSLDPLQFATARAWRCPRAYAVKTWTNYDIQGLLCWWDTDSVGPESGTVVNFWRYGILLVKWSVKLLRVYTKWSLVLKHFCAGGGNVTFAVLCTLGAK